MKFVGIFLFGAVGLSYWYYKMFLASGDSWVWIRSRYRWTPKNIESVIIPTYSIVMVLVPLFAWFSTFDPPRWLFICASIPVFLLLILCVVGFLPIKFPNRFYPEWQYAKRHGLLDNKGKRSSPVEWCNRFVSFGLGYALSWSGVSSCPVGWGVSRDLVRMSRLR